MSRGLALVRALGAPVVATARAARGVAMVVAHVQRHQPSLGAEMRASFRGGREDLLATVMGPLAGQAREPGARARPPRSRRPPRWKGGASPSATSSVAEPPRTVALT